jgi:hypothetical protein
MTPFVYAAPVDNEGALHRFVDTCQTILNFNSIFERMQPSVKRTSNLMKAIPNTCYKYIPLVITKQLNVS